MPAKAKSKRQFRFLAAVKAGNAKKKGLPRHKAGELLSGSNYKSLPEKK